MTVPTGDDVPVVARVSVPPAVDVVATVRALANGPRDPSLRLAADGVWRASRHPTGPATLHLSRDGDDLVAEAWGPGNGEALAQLPRLIGAEDSLVGFDSGAHPVVARLHRQRPGVRFGRSDDVWRALFAAILGQKVIAAEAEESFRRLTYRLGAPAPGPARLQLVPAPAAIVSAGPWVFHTSGVEGRRAGILQRVAREMPRLATVDQLDGPALRRRLEAIHGIGPWTSAWVAQVAVGDADAVPVGDYKFPSLVTNALAGERRGTDERMLELLEPFMGHRARVVRLLEGSGLGPGRRGPRTRMRRVERH